MGDLVFTSESFYFDETRGKHGKGAWRGELYSAPLGGKRLHKGKTFKAKGKRDAKKEFDAWKQATEEAAQKSLARGDMASQAEMPVPDYVSQFIDELASTGENERSTADTMRSSLTHIKAAFPDVAVQDLDRKAVTQWLADMAETPLAATGEPLCSSSRRKARALLQRALDRAVMDGVIDVNPVRQTKPPKLRSEKPMNALHTESYGTLAGKLAALEPCPVVIGAQIALLTGLREGEVCGLQWRDINETDSTLTVRRAIGRCTRKGDGKSTYVKEPKNGKTRTVGIPPSLMQALLTWKAIQRGAFAEHRVSLTGASYVIGDALGYHSPEMLGKEWHTLARFLGVRGDTDRYPTFHDLRHSYVTVLVEAGQDVKTIQSSAGHSSAGFTLDRYACADPAAQGRVAASIENVLARAVA